MMETRVREILHGRFDEDVISLLLAAELGRAPEDAGGLLLVQGAGGPAFPVDGAAVVAESELARDLEKGPAAHLPAGREHRRVVPHPQHERLLRVRKSQFVKGIARLRGALERLLQLRKKTHHQRHWTGLLLQFADCDQVHRGHPSGTSEPLPVKT